MSEFPLPPEWVTASLHEGQAIPAHPLALDDQRRFDERRQRGLTRYYHSAGAGGIAVGVHTTQFEIRRKEYGLLEPVLRLAYDTVGECDQTTGRRTILIAGVCGPTEQALQEAGLAQEIGYHAGLLSLGALSAADDGSLIEHCRRVAHEIPLVGFYLQPAVGGRILSVDFWRAFAEIPNVVAIKIAPFNRYQTLDVIRGVAEAGRANDIPLYTGNDDNIVADLLTEYTTGAPGATLCQRIVGGLLGHWACWTRKGVELLERCRELRGATSIPSDLLGLAPQVTDSNAAFFDPAHNFAGSIPGIHEVLRRQGLLANNYCLDPREALSVGQAEEIDRVYRDYPHLNDDLFVAEHLDEWLG